MSRINRTVLHDSIPTFNTFKKGGVVRSINDLFSDGSSMYQYLGQLPLVVEPNSTPSDGWVPLWSNDVLSVLGEDSGASLIGTNTGDSVQYFTNKVGDIPIKYKSVYEAPIQGTMYPQGLDESTNYWFVCKCNTHSTPISSEIHRIHKTTFATDVHTTVNTATHNLLVVDDDTVMYIAPVDGNNGYEYSNGLIKYSFKDKTELEVPLTGLNSAYAMTWDGLDTVYQLDLFNQQVASGDIGDGRYDQIRVYSLKAGSLVGVIPMPREIVREGFVQDMHYDSGCMYFFTGGSFLGVEDSNKRVTSIYKASLNGTVLDGCNFRADSFSQVLKYNGEVGVSYEAQGITTLNGSTNLLVFVGIPQKGTSFHIASSRGATEYIRQGVGASSYLREIQYNSIQDLNVTESTLSASGDALGYLGGRMLNNSRLVTYLDSTNYPSVTTQLGVSNGLLEIVRVNPHRVYGTVRTTTALEPSKIKTFSVFGRKTTPVMDVQSNVSSTKTIYTGTNPVSTGFISMNLSGYSSISVIVTNSSIGNPCGFITLSGDTLKYFLGTDSSVLVQNAYAKLGFKINRSGLQVVLAEGSPVVQAVLGS